MQDWQLKFERRLCYRSDRRFREEPRSQSGQRSRKSYPFLGAIFDPKQEGCPLRMLAAWLPGWFRTGHVHGTNATGGGGACGSRWPSVGVTSDDGHNMLYENIPAWEADVFEFLDQHVTDW